MKKQKHSAHKEQSISMIDVEIPKEPVELYKILKFESLVPSGGVAKLVISQGLVLLNGEVETRKRKKIVSGDVIEFAGEVLKVKLALSE